MLQSYSKNVYTDSRYIYLQWSSLYHNCVRLCGILLVITYLLGMAQTVYRWRNYVNNSRSIFTSTDIIINLSLKYIWIKLNWAEHILCINCIVFTTDLYYYIIFGDVNHLFFWLICLPYWIAARLFIDFLGSQGKVSVIFLETS